MSDKSTACPVLSIIIPTRNRFQYVTHTIKSILNIKASDFELVIHDTSDSKELETFVTQNFDDKRLRYFYTEPPLTFSETFNKSVLLSSGEYVCIIGDDDGVNPEIVEAAKWAKEQNIDALTPTLSVFYWWPDFRLRYYKESDASKVKIKQFTGNLCFPEIEKEMANSAAKAFQDFSNLPKIYNGIVRRHCLDEVYSKAGAFFFGSSPDISGALAVATYVKCLCIIDYPLIIVGSSANSGSGRSAMKKHVGNLEDEPQTKPFCNTWPDEVPAFYSVQTVWAQAAIEGLKSTGRNDICNLLNIYLLHAMCFVYNPNYLKIILNNLLPLSGKQKINKLIACINFMLGIIGTYSIRAKSHILRLFKYGYYDFACTYEDVDNINSASTELTKYLKLTGNSFLKTVARSK